VEKLYAVIGMAANAAKDTFFKVASREDGGSRIVLFYGLKAAIIALLALPVMTIVRHEPLIHPVSLLFALPIAALTGATYLVALRSLVHGEPSTNVTIFRLNFVLSSVLAVAFLGETLTARKVAGIGLCLLAVLLFFLGSRTRRRSPSVGGRGIGLALTACAAAAGLNTLNKVALSAGALIFHLAFYRYVLIAAGCAVALAARRRSFLPSPRQAATAAACAVLMLTSFAFILTALAAGDITLVIPISQVSFLFTALFSFLVFRERLDWGKAAGLGAAVIGLVVMG